MKKSIPNFQSSVFSSSISTSTSSPPPPKKNLKKQATGLEFPEVTSFWLGDRARCVGAGARTKKIAILSVKVYAVALYVEAEKAARELGVRSRGGFFDDAETADADFCSALADGAFTKALRIDLVRDVELIVTEVLPLAHYWPAEDYHQNYFVNNPDQGYCTFVVAPKVRKLGQHYSEWLKP